MTTTVYDETVGELLADAEGILHAHVENHPNDDAKGAAYAVLHHLHRALPRFIACLSKQATVTVPVVSWVYWNGDEQGGGGFNWYPPETPYETLLDAFRTEAAAWAGYPHRVRLVYVPDVPAYLTGTDLTDYLDAERLDDMETGLPAHRVSICATDDDLTGR